MDKFNYNFGENNLKGGWQIQSTPVNQNSKITLEDLTAEQFQMVEKACIIDDLKDQYKKLKLSLEFDLPKQISGWLETVNSIHTRRMYLTAVNHFLRYCNYEILKVGPKEADQYILFLKQDKCSGGTVKLYVRSVSSFFTHLERYNFVKKNPFRNTKIKIDAKPKDKYVPSLEEINILLFYILENYSKEIYIQMEIAISLMQKYGVRVGFLNNIKIKENVLVSISKGKEYKIFLDKEDDIAYYTQNKNIVERLNSNSISKYFNDSVKALYQQGQIGKFSPHCLRHFFAIQFYKNHNSNKDTVYELMQLLGHSNYNTTLVYLRSLNMIK